MGGAYDRVTADADTGGLAHAHLGDLPDGFVSQCSRTGNDTDLAWFVDVAWHDADFTLTWGDDTWAIGSD